MGKRDWERLARIRGKLLKLNTLFLKEFEEYKKEREGSRQRNASTDLGTEFQKKHETFVKRWGLGELERGKLFSIPTRKDAVYVGIDTVRSGDNVPGRIPLIVDLTYPLETILERVEEEIRKWHQWFEEDRKEDVFDHLKKELDNLRSMKIFSTGTASSAGNGPKDRKLRRDMEDYIKTVSKLINEPDKHTFRKLRQDIEEYEKALEVYDRHNKKGQSWRVICSELGLSRDNARDCERRIKKLIQEGLPGFPPFPTE